MPENPFSPNLTNAPIVSQYVASPIEDIHMVGSRLTQRYEANKAAADQMEIAINNLDVIKSDQGLKDGAIDSFDGALKSLKESNEFERGTSVIQGAAKDFALNSGVQYAIKNSTSRKAYMAGLQKRLEAKEISATQYNLAMSRADAAYEKGGGVAYNKDTGSYNIFGTPTVPPLFNASEEINKYLKDAKPNTSVGTGYKGDDGNWYTQVVTRTADGKYHYVRTTEKMSEKELQRIGLNYLESNPNYQDYKNFMLGEAPAVLSEERRLVYEKYLESQGYKRPELGVMKDSELYIKAETAALINPAVAAGAEKYGYTNEGISGFGVTPEYDASVKASAKKEKEISDKVITSYIGDIVTNPNQRPLSMNSYAESMVILNNRLKGDQARVSNLVTEIARLEASLTANDVPEGGSLDGLRNQLKDRRKMLDDARVGLNQTKSAIKTANDYVFTARKQALGSAGEEVVNKFHADRKAVVDNKEKFDNIAFKINDIRREALKSTGVDILDITTYPSAERGKGSHFSAKYKVRTTDDIMRMSTQDSPRVNLKLESKIRDKMISSGISKEDIEFYEAHSNMVYDHYNWSTSYNKAMGKDGVNARLKSLGESNTISPGVIDLGTDPTSGEESYFSTKLSGDYANNKTAFTLMSKNGKVLYEGDEKGEGNPNTLRFTGATTDVVGSHGYLYTAVVTDEDSDLFNTTVYVSPNNGMAASGGLELIRESLKTYKGNQIVPLNSRSQIMVSSLMNKLQRDSIERQLSGFQDIDPANGSFHQEVVSLNGKVNAIVTRSYPGTKEGSPAVTGEPRFEVTLVNAEDNKPLNTPNSKVLYKNITDVEFELEKASTTREYKVDSSELTKVTQNNFSNIQLDEQITTPFLSHKMAKVMKELDAALPFPLRATSMTRDIETNKEFNGADDSGHLYGNGVDFSIKGTEEYTKRVQKWFKDNKTLLDKLNLTYDIHDRGTGSHIDLKLKN